MKMHSVFFLILSFCFVTSLRAEWRGGYLDYYDLTDGLDAEIEDGSQASVPEETTLGGSVAVEIIARNGGLVRDPAMTRQVNLVGRTIASYSKRPHLRYVFDILDSSVPNSFSAPGGFIFITKGAYEACENYDQLAGLLAHEIAHVEMRHPLRVIYEHDYMPYLSRVVRGVTADFDLFDKNVERVTQRIMHFGYPSYVEYRADLEGRELAYSAGFQRDGLEQFLRLMFDRSGRDRKVFPAHPELYWRLRYLEAPYPPRAPREDAPSPTGRVQTLAPSLRRLK